MRALALLLFIPAFSYGQLLGAAIDAVAESGPIVFTRSHNQALKKKEAASEEFYGSTDAIYGTMYLKQKISKVPTSYQDGERKIEVVLLPALQKDMETSLWISSPEEAVEAKHLCFAISPEELDVKDPNHFAFVDMVSKLPEGKHTIQVKLRKWTGVKGSFELDLSQGKGKYQEALEALEIERERIAAEEERKRKEAEELRRKQEEERLRIVAEYDAATDHVYITLQNKSNRLVKVYQETAHKATDASYEIKGKQTFKIRCRPSEVIYRNGEAFHTVTAGNNGTTLDVTPEAVTISSARTTYGGDDAWKQWTIKTSEGDWSMRTVYGGNDAWKNWSIGAKSGDMSARTQYGGSDAWKSWSFNTPSGTATIKTQYGGDDAWKSWNVSLNGVTLQVRTTYGGDDAWKQWSVSGGGGSMTIRTTYGGDDAWKQWSVEDKMPNEDPAIKMAAVFCAMTAACLPYYSVKDVCAYKGYKLYGKVKFVEYGEDLKIKYVDYGEDIKVKFVDYGADSCGEWQTVEYGEDLKVKVVEYGEDIKVKKVDYGQGM